MKTHVVVKENKNCSVAQFCEKKFFIVREENETENEIETFEAENVKSDSAPASQASLTFPSFSLVFNSYRDGNKYELVRDIYHTISN